MMVEFNEFGCDNLNHFSEKKLIDFEGKKQTYFVFVNSKLLTNLVMIVVQYFLPLIKYQINAIKISNQTFAFEKHCSGSFQSPLFVMMCFAFQAFVLYLIFNFFFLNKFDKQQIQIN